MCPVSVPTTTLFSSTDTTHVKVQSTMEPSSTFRPVKGVGPGLEGCDSDGLYRGFLTGDCCFKVSLPPQTRIHLVPTVTRLLLLPHQAMSQILAVHLFAECSDNWPVRGLKDHMNRNPSL